MWCFLRGLTLHLHALELINPAAPFAMSMSARVVVEVEEEVKADGQLREIFHLNGNHGGKACPEQRLQTSVSTSQINKLFLILSFETSSSAREILLAFML